MKTIGLIGGMSWESTVPYYRIVNETVKHRLGGLHSAKILMYSVDFHEIEQLQRADAWEAAARLMSDAACRLEGAGADFLVLCSNTMHKVAVAVESAVRIPLLHIADATAHAINVAGYAKVGLLGTRFTMEQDFYKQRLVRQHGLEVLVPSAGDREIVHRVIYEELCLGRISGDSRAEYARVMQALVARGAQAIVLGCTEISLLIGSNDSTVPLFDTTAIHAQWAAEYALSDETAFVGVNAT